MDRSESVDLKPGRYRNGRRITALRIFAIMAGFSLAASLAQAAPVGMVLRKSGNCQVKSGGGAFQPAHLMQSLEAGDIVQCGPGSGAVIMLGGGQQYELGPDTRATINRTGVQGGHLKGIIHGGGSRVAQVLANSRIGGISARAAAPRSSENLVGSQGWVLDAPTQHFEWTPITEARSYLFTLFDPNDNIVWSQRSQAPAVDYPADYPHLFLHRPYTWRVTAFGASGRPLPEYRWGFVTVLPPEEADQLTKDAAEMADEIAKNPDDRSLKVLLASLYTQHGVLERSVIVLDDLQALGEPGADEALDDVLTHAGSYGRMLFGR